MASASFYTKAVLNSDWLEGVDLIFRNSSRFILMHRFEQVLLHVNRLYDDFCVEMCTIHGRSLQSRYFLTAEGMFIAAVMSG